MSRRHLHLVLALLLPLMALRALLPAGYMTVVQGDELRVVMCSEGLQVLATDGATRHDGDQQPPAGGGECAFALSAFSAPPPAPLSFVISSGTAAVLAFVPQPLAIAASVHRPPARAPPSAA